jgi:hypothetical protein
VRGTSECEHAQAASALAAANLLWRHDSIFIEPGIEPASRGNGARRSPSQPAAEIDPPGASQPSGWRKQQRSSGAAGALA